MVRNLLYYIYPITGNGTWQHNVAELLRRIRLFNGRRVVAIATDQITDPAEAVKGMFWGQVHEFIEMPNNPQLREVAAFTRLLERVETKDANQITFYGHAKGVTRPVNEGVSVHPWADLLYETCLDYPALVEDLLSRYPIAGSLKKVGHGFDGSASSWHYSGGCYWLRNREVFSRDWRRVDPVWWGTESWPGLHFKPEEAGVLFHEGVAPTLDLYNMDYLKNRVFPELESWRKLHSGSKRLVVA